MSLQQNPEDHLSLGTHKSIFSILREISGKRYAGEETQHIFSFSPIGHIYVLIFLLTLWQMRIYTINFFFFSTFSHEWASALNFTSKFIYMILVAVLYLTTDLYLLLFKVRFYPVAAFVWIGSFQGQTENFSCLSVIIHNCSETSISPMFITCAKITVQTSGYNPK